MKKKKKKFRVLFSGGGTLGPVMPLIAVACEIRDRKDEVELLWVGTYRGVERAVVRAHKIEYTGMFAAKLRRYWSLKNILDVFVFVLSLVQAFVILVAFRPSVLVTAGGFVSVPLHIIAFIFRIPTVVHQQDIKKGLANKIMGVIATRITVTFEHMLKSFPEKKVEWTGNPIRSTLVDGNEDRGYARFHLDPNIPTVLVFGGGTGALSLNQMLAEALPYILKRAQVLHITGQGKEVAAPFVRHGNKKILERYHPYDFFMDEEMADAYAVAQVVVSRAGLSSLSEIAALGKACVLVPIENSHQVENAKYYEEKQAAKIVQPRSGYRVLSEAVLDLLKDNYERLHLEKKVQKLNKKTAARQIAQVIEDVAKYGK